MSGSVIVGGARTPIGKLSGKARNIGRAEQDEFAAMSHERATSAAKNGLFDDEIANVEVSQRRGDPLLVSADEGVRPDIVGNSPTHPTCRRITLDSAIPHRVVEDPTRNTPNECRAVAGDCVRANSAVHACTSDGLMETGGSRPNVFAIWLPTALRILRSVAGWRGGCAAIQASHHSRTGLSAAPGSGHTPEPRPSTCRRSHSCASRFRAKVGDATYLPR
jgi:hypothetical protein